MERKRIYLSSPTMHGEEQDAVQEAIEKLVWSRIDETVNTFLEQKTLKMLADEYREKLEQNAGMYYI